MSEQKTKKSGRITVESFQGEGMPSIFAYTRNWGPIELPVIAAEKDPGKSTYTVVAHSGLLSDPTPITVPLPFLLSPEALPASSYRSEGVD